LKDVILFGCSHSAGKEGDMMPFIMISSSQNSTKSESIRIRFRRHSAAQSLKAAWESEFPMKGVFLFRSSVRGIHYQKFK